MKEIVTSISSFETLIQEDCLYVDKTAYLHKLITRKGPYFFISRPRRFGKSLMLSTLKCIFEGKRELFGDLAISKMDYDWKTYPVLSFDLSEVGGDSVEAVNEGLNDIALTAARSLGIPLVPKDYSPQTFRALWEEIRNRQLRVVVLVDEYDIPLQGFLNRPQELDQVRQLMHDFYVKFKAFAPSIRFFMMTGVSKFTRLSLFSGLNNLVDLSMDREYAGFLGYTDEELDHDFREHIQAFADVEGLSYEDIREKLRYWYDGYHFTPDFSVCVYNPISLGYALTTKEFTPYWTETGNATLILERIRSNNYIPAELEGLKVTTSKLNTCDIQAMPIESLFFQSGYLTLKGKDEDGLYRLGIPNKEVRDYLNEQYSQHCMVMSPKHDVYQHAQSALVLLRAGKVDTLFHQTLPALYAAVPSEWRMKDEAEVKRYFFLFFSMVGAEVFPEVSEALGKPDAVLKTPDAIYIIEFKFKRSVEEALAQIREKHYADALRNDTRKIIAVGLNFNGETRTLDPPVIVDLTEAHHDEPFFTL